MRAWGLWIALLAAGAATSFASGKIEFSRYEAILSRKPFGEPPADTSVGGGPGGTAAAQTSFVKDIRMCAITESAEFGIRVGFVDIAAKKNYYLRVGDTEDGIQLVDADYEKEAALLQKGAEAYWINMSGQVNPGGSGPVQPASSIGSAPAAGTSLPTTGRPSYSDRVRKRREALEERRRQKEEQQKSSLSPEERDKLLKEYQMELIRAAGEKGPALPIPLTKEMDNQLVAEGVLPPLEGAAGETEPAAPGPAGEQPAAEPAQ